MNGVAAGMVIPVITAYAGDVVHKGKESESMGVSMLMFYVGMGVGTLLGDFLWHLFGMASVFYVMSGISVIALLLVLPFLPEVKNCWLIYLYNYIYSIYPVFYLCYLLSFVAIMFGSGQKVINKGDLTLYTVV